MSFPTNSVFLSTELFSGLHDSSKYPSQVQQCCGLDGYDPVSDLQSLFLAFEDRSKGDNPN